MCLHFSYSFSIRSGLGASCAVFLAKCAKKESTRCHVVFVYPMCVFKAVNRTGIYTILHDAVMTPSAPGLGASCAVFLASPSVL
jgi:hypothetical protein